MDFQSDRQRKAVFASMPKIRGFALRGRGGKARRNRALVAGLGVAGLGTALVATKAYGRGGVAALMRPTGYFYTAAGGKTFSSMRPANSLIERTMLGLPGVGRLLGKRGEVFGTPLGARLKSALTVGRWRPDATFGLRKTMGLRTRLAQAADRASLWNVLGPGRLHGALEDVRTLTKDRAQQAISAGRNWLVAPRRVLTSRQRRQIAALKQVRHDLSSERILEAANAVRGGMPREIKKVANRQKNALIRLARVRTKIATINRRRILKPSRLEQGVRRPLVVLAQRVHRLDIKINRKARRVARKVGIPA